ncbi:hypothetical protein Dsin_009419 [Dipteronia sinensis]|uniref:Uncharacterized protein n=1 Tax=Dipteronia sinensis TaxID=43782 RepID=A0AAE0ARS5_9ROSI|nr:hypothetical protein Dsin_009419 [Dipteronia sinensis]
MLIEIRTVAEFQDLQHINYYIDSFIFQKHTTFSLNLSELSHSLERESNKNKQKQPIKVSRALTLLCTSVLVREKANSNSQLGLRRKVSHKRVQFDGAEVEFG